MKQYLKLFGIVVFSTIILFLSGCQTTEYKEDLLSEDLTNEEIIGQVTPIIQSFLDSQYDYAIGKDKLPQWNSLVKSGADTLKQQIDLAKDNMYYNNKTRMIAYTSKLVFDNNTTITKSGSLLIVSNVFDHFTLTKVSDYDPAHPDTMETAIPYKIILEKVGKSWIIQDWEEHGIVGNSYRWYWDKWQAPYDPINTSWELQSVSKATTSVSYVRSKAVAYAVAHVNSPSSDYPNYSAYGGDCTNFVSQCLEAGGWTQTTKSAGRGSVYSWYHDSGFSSSAPLSARSTSWTDANSFQSFLVNSSRIVPASYTLLAHEVGDVIQLVSNGVAYHTMIVTSKTASTLKVHYRNAAGYSVGVNVDISSFPSSHLKPRKIANSYGFLIKKA